jgi:2-oxoglutarate dehydrogenase E1 component
VANYPKAQSFVWCQEEPKNMGGWTFIAPRLMEVLNKMPLYAGRKESASPAVGSLAVHKYEQKKLIETAFSL